MEKLKSEGAYQKVLDEMQKTIRRILEKTKNLKID